MVSFQRIRRSWIRHFAVLVVLGLFSFVCGTEAPAGAAEKQVSSPKGQKQSPVDSGKKAQQDETDDDHEKYESATDVDPKRAIDAGFTVLNYDRKGDDTVAARLIEKEMIPELVKDLPWPEAGFLYALKDIDGDEAPELFLVIKHWKVCNPGCPVRIYKFYDGVWKLLLLEQNSMAEAIRPARSPGEKGQVAFMSKGEQMDGPTIVRFYRLEGDKFTHVRTIGGAKKK